MSKRKILSFSIITLIIIISLISISLLWINLTTKNKIYSNTENLPFNSVGLIPGCNKYIAQGVINQYYQLRIDAGVKLYNQGKIDYILVSGDNAHASYDEPREMRNSLVEAGIPNDKIISDYAGFRTLDTIVRAKEVFQLDKVTFISQNFQNQRGVFIGNKRDIDVIAFDAENADLIHSFKTLFREIFAKVKMLIDIYITDKEPKFLGDLIIIGDE